MSFSGWSTDRCLVMGIVNRTPDSFYDGGRMGLDESVRYALDLVDEGADLLDVGAVKAGPGDEVGETDELDRLMPLVEALVKETDVPLSVETTRASVGRAVLDAGAPIINAVSSESTVTLATECARVGGGLVVMHDGGQVRGRPMNPRYDDVVTEVASTLRDLALAAEEAGVGQGQIAIDPGLDFGKTTFHSLELMRRLDELAGLGYPLLVAPSRKDVVGETLGLPPDQRLEGTLALVALSVLGGASVVRVHDVRAAVRTVRMVEAVSGSRRPAAPIRGLWE